MKKYIYSIIYLILFILFLRLFQHQLQSTSQYIILLILFLPILYGFFSKRKKVKELEKEAEEELKQKNY